MKFLFVFFVILFTCFLSFGQTLNEIKDIEFGLNQGSPNMLQKYQLGTRVIKNDVLIARAKYDFAVQGGAQTTFNLVGEDGKPVVIPNGAVIVDCLIDVITTGAAGGTGTMSLTAQSAGDLKATFAAASYTGRVACVPVGTAATAIKLTANRTLTGTIATTNWTQGKFWIYVYYIVGGT